MVTTGATTVFADGAETSPNGWTLDGFESVEASFTTPYDQFYLASNRSYVSYDKYLQTGPYNFSFAGPARLRGELPLPGRPAGQLLGLVVLRQQHQRSTPVAAWCCRSTPTRVPTTTCRAQAWRGRIQNYDAPFGLQKADSFTLT